MPGGVFPYPPSVGELLRLLPPPKCFRGPFVKVDALMDVFAKIQLPDEFPGGEFVQSCSKGILFFEGNGAGTKFPAFKVF